MSSTARRRRLAAHLRLLVGTALAGLLLAGCTVPMQDEAQPLPKEAAPAPSQTAQVAPPRERQTTVYFVSGHELVAVAESIPDRSANGVMDALAAGPPESMRDELRSLLLDPVTGAPLLVVTSVSPSGEVVLVRNDAFVELAAADQLVLIGQVVLSLDEVGLSRIVINDASGYPIPVSLPDGRAQSWPVTADNFRELIEE